MSDSEVLTLTPNTGNALGSQPSPPRANPWGILRSTTTYLKSVELNKPNFLLGRAPGCDVMISRENFPPNGIRTVSKTHFIISYDETKSIAMCTDQSKNGTYVNQNIIGEGKMVILQNDDEIAIGTKQQRVYIYQTIEKEKCPYLPPELRRKYVASRKLGEGACGEVKLIFEKDTCQEFAVKKIVKAKVGYTSAAGLNSSDRIKNEIDILQSLFHPCIMSAKEITETNDAVFIILEYMEGGDLVDRINSSLYPLPENEIKLIFYQIAIGVQYLHSHGITHRDLKPANVLLKSQESETLVKLSDFGLSKIIHNATCMVTMCGTPWYVAPEIMDGQCAPYTQAVDIWSLGVILFNMLSKELPFPAEVLHELRTLILSGKYNMETDTWKSVCDGAKDLVRKMLIRNPNRRIKIDDIINHPWIAEDEAMQTKARLLMSEDENGCDYSSNVSKKPRLN